jgi:hypothetical protein
MKLNSGTEQLPYKKGTPAWAPVARLTGGACRQSDPPTCAATYAASFCTRDASSERPRAVRSLRASAWASRPVHVCVGDDQAHCEAHWAPRSMPVWGR